MTHHFVTRQLATITTVNVHFLSSNGETKSFKLTQTISYDGISDVTCNIHFTSNMLFDSLSLNKFSWFVDNLLVQNVHCRTDVQQSKLPTRHQSRSTLGSIPAEAPRAQLCHECDRRWMKALRISGGERCGWPRPLPPRQRHSWNALWHP